MEDDNKNDLTDLNDISDFIHDEGTDSELSDLSNDFLSDDERGNVTGEFDPTGIHDFSEQSFTELDEQEATSIIEADMSETLAESSNEDTSFFTPGNEIFNEEEDNLDTEETSQWNTPGNDTLETSLMEDTGLRENLQNNQAQELDQDTDLQTSSYQFETPNPADVTLEEDDQTKTFEQNSPVDLSLVGSESDNQVESEPEADINEYTAALPSEVPISDQKENFSEVKQFAENMVIGDVQTNANPPYSILLTGLEDQSSSDEIIAILKEHNLAGDEHEALFRNSLSLGTLLISQISEYSAVLLAHKLRRFNAQIKIGLSALLHSPKNYQGDSFKIQTAKSLFQNKSEHEDFSKTSQFSEIFHSNLDYLEGYQIVRYLGIVHVEKVMPITKTTFEEQSEIYKGDVISDLDKKARNKGANALLGMRFHTQQASPQNLIIQGTATAVFLQKRKNLDAGPGQNL